MRNKLTPHRPGLTAIAAVLALSATPVFAQEAQTAPAPDAPVISAPAPTLPAADAAPAAPAASSMTTENMSAPASEPVAPMATRSPVVIHQADASSPAAPATTKHATAPVTRNAKPSPATPVPTPAPIVKAAAPTPAPAAAAPVAKTSSVTTNSTTRDDNRELELAGIGAVGLLALIGGAVALGRRRREDEEEMTLAPATVTTSAPVEPVAYRTIDPAPPTIAPAITPVAVEGAPTTPLHEDFDLSRYGVHVQAAYRGPTEDNPSLSLRHRLKRARFMDQRARENGDYTAPFEPATAAERKPAPQNLVGAKLKDGLRALRPQGGLRPAFG